LRNSAGRLTAAEEGRYGTIPDFLLPLRQKAAQFAGVDPGTLEHVLVTEYGPDAAIGWHRDRPIFADVIGVSLLSPCTFRFRKQTGTGGSEFIQ
jgi:alkylated DNA repair dioxygenase AlkB